MAGMSYRLVFLSLCIAIGSFAFLLLLQPYRIKRFEAAIDPWAYAFDQGYQVTQALMAIGRGGWFGTGLGKSIQKFFYLPEAHTDFLIAVTIEELGLLSCLLLLVLYILSGMEHYIHCSPSDECWTTGCRFIYLWSGLLFLLAIGRSLGGQLNVVADYWCEPASV